MTKEFEMAVENANAALSEVWNQSDGMRFSDVIEGLRGLVSQAEEMIADLQCDTPMHVTVSGS